MHKFDVYIIETSIQNEDDDVRGNIKVQLYLFSIYNNAMKRINPIVVKIVVAIVFPVCLFLLASRLLST